MEQKTTTILLILLIIALWWILLVLKRNKWFKEAKIRRFNLLRSECNPLIAPDGIRDWEAEGTFNPAAIIDDEGAVHLLYRAIGSDGMSRLGYATSTDGNRFEGRLSYPVYESRPGRDIPYLDDIEKKEYDPLLYPSGGGWAGCEDPRAVIIEDRVYMTYLAFGGWDSMRIALTSLSLFDFKKGRWNWKHPVFLSAPGETNKNWVLFPEKIRGKFAILHSISPEILIEYVDNPDFISKESYIKSRSPKGGRDEHWDNWVRGAGPPPIKTTKGWLLLYHAMDREDPNKYKLGAMLLDLDEPTKILYRSPLPVLEPDMEYENNNKPGVVYASGAIIKDGKLFVYYGGGDRHVCVAHAPVEELLQWLIEHGNVQE